MVILLIAIMAVRKYNYLMMAKWQGLEQTMEMDQVNLHVG
jgi:hypothetical protein